ncbi:MAG: hypothetical protein OCD00_12850 [Colwellia sp.]
MRRVFHRVMACLLIAFLTYLANYWLASHWQQAIATKALTIQPIKKRPRDSISFSDIVLPPVPISTITKLKSVKSEIAKALNKSEPAKQDLASKLYEQLVTDNAVNIEIAWPDMEKERDELFNYLYNCAGMQFGVMHNNQVTVISKTSNQPNSAWLRVASGQLNNQELKWLQQAALSGVPVRLFPQEIDRKLAKLLTRSLAGNTLKSFWGRYQLSSQGLMISNLFINKQKVNGYWLIDSGCNS